MKEGQNGDGEGGAFGRIRSGTEFIEEHQTGIIRLIQNGNNVGHVGGKGTEALLNALLIADIGKYFFKNSQLRTVGGGNMKPALSHDGKQADGLQRYGFSAGIGAGDHQKVKIFSQLQGDGNDLFRIKKRVASMVDPQESAGVKLRLRTMIIAGKLRFREYKVQVGQQLQIRFQIKGLGSGLAAQGCENGLDLFLFLDFQLPKLIVQADHSHRLNKISRTGSRLVMNHAGDLALVLGFYRETVASVSGGDDCVLKPASTAV